MNFMGKGNIESTFKSKDTEEWLDIVFTRKVGYALAIFCKRLGVHPNAVTVVSIFLGVGAGLCWLDESLSMTVAGIALLMMANFLDSTDGQLARMTGKKTLWGRLLDGLAGDAWFISIYICLGFRLLHTPVPFIDGVDWKVWHLLLLELTCGFLFHARQAALADYYRNIYLLFHGDHSELNDSEELDREWHTLDWKKDWAWKTGLFFYKNYTCSQELMTPCFQKLRAALKAKPQGVESLGESSGGSGMDFSQEFGQEFCRRTRHLLKWTNILSFNTRAIALYLTLLANVPWVYFIFEMTVMEVIMLYMKRTHERVCREMNATL